MSYKSIRRSLEKMIYDEGMTPTGDENLGCGDRDTEMVTALQRVENRELVHDLYETFL